MNGVATGNFFVLTGGPGSGKTTLIEALADAGFATCPEAGRGIIRDQMALNGPALPWNDPALFAELMLSWDLRSHRAAAGRTGPVFFDRGVPDTVGYLRLSGLAVPAHMHEATARFRYDVRVFVTPPWRAIFARDDERSQTWDEAVRTHAVMVETYTGLGYEPVAVPRAPVEERLRFILAGAGAR
jgi:predicted ATPase